MKTVEVHSDGSSGQGGGKPGAWAWVIFGGGRVLACQSGMDISTTNNVMEMTGALNGLRALRNHGFWQPGDRATLISDSQLVLGLASGRFHPTTNLELAKQLRQAFLDVRASDRWVRGHTLKKHQDWRVPPPGFKGVWTDVLLNDRCDKLAHEAKQKAKRALGMI